MPDDFDFDKEFPQTNYWNPEKPEAIQGVVLSTTSRDDKYHPGEKVPSLELELSTGEVVTVTGYRDVLRDKLLAARPGVGDTVTIAFGGLQQPKDPKNNPFNAYGVRIDQRSSTATDPVFNDNEPF